MTEHREEEECVLLRECIGDIVEVRSLEPYIEKHNEDGNQSEHMCREISKYRMAYPGFFLISTHEQMKRLYHTTPKLFQVSSPS